MGKCCDRKPKYSTGQSLLVPGGAASFRCKTIQSLHCQYNLLGSLETFFFKIIFLSEKHYFSINMFHFRVIDVTPIYQNFNLLIYR